MMYLRKLYRRSAIPTALDDTVTRSLQRTGTLTWINPYGSLWEGQGVRSIAEFLINTFIMSVMTSRSLFKMGILNYSKRVREMFEMTKLLPPPIRKN